MNNKPTQDQSKPKQLTEYQLITQAIKIPDNWRILVLARIFYCGVCVVVPVWLMQHLR